MTINAALNLVFPIRWGADGAPLMWAYHTPISREVFEANYRVIAAAKAALFGKGVGYAVEVGPRIAALALADAARQDALETGTDTDANPLLAELKRLTTVLAPGPNGFELLPAELALGRKAIDEDDWAEAESAVVFFTCGYAMAMRASRDKTGSALALALKGSMTSLPPMEYAASSLTSTKAETSEPPTASSLPS